MMTMTETPSSSRYSDIFLRQLLNSLRYAIGQVRGKKLLDESTRNHALTNADLGLQQPKAWGCTRDLLLLLAPLMEQAGWREEWIPFLERAIEQATDRGDLEMVGECHFYLGQLYQLLGNYDRIEFHYHRSAELFAALGDAERQGRTLNRWAYATLTTIIRVELALSLLAEAESLVRSPEERGYACTVRGTKAKRDNTPSIAHAYFLEALAHWEPLNNPRLMAWGLNNLGTALSDLKRYEESIETFHQALEYFALTIDPAYQAIALQNLGIAYYHLQQPQKALHYYQDAITVIRQSNRGHPLAMLYNAMGKSYLALKQYAQARVAYELAIEIFSQNQDIAQVVNVMSNLGELSGAQGKWAECRRILLEALALIDQHRTIPSYHFYRAMLIADLEMLDQEGR